MEWIFLEPMGLVNGLDGGVVREKGVSMLPSIKVLDGEWGA